MFAAALKKPALKMADCLLWVGEELLLQARVFKYFGVLFTSDGTIEQDMYQCFGAASVVMQALY